MKNLCLALFYLLLIWGCGPKKNMTGTSPGYRQLSVEESKKLITPTLYYIPVYNQSTLPCEARRVLKDEKGNDIIAVCQSVYDSCLMQGTCQILSSGQRLLINVGSVVGSERRFTLIKNSTCIYGIGASKKLVSKTKTMCLDPYYSVAADLDIYTVGDVIFIPSLVGLAMPDGSIHDGYLIVRDAGGAIKGYGRFDFFTGFTLNKISNPLAQLGFADKQTHVPYFLVTGEQALQILIKRSYPLLSDKK